VLDKIRALNEAKRRLGRDTPRVDLNFVVFRHNQHERRAFEALASSLDGRAVFSSPSLNTRLVDRGRDMEPLGLPPHERVRRIQAIEDEWLPDDPALVRPAYRRDALHDSAAYNGSKCIPCRWPWTDAVVNWDGSVVTCCGVFDSVHDMGNVFDTDFGAIWNSRRYRMARRSFTRRVPEAEGTPCRDCPGMME
jgi:radical SAM protein with 4Fe4S-binding SPASM domain